MKSFKHSLQIILVLVICFFVPVAFAGTAFTYQGRLLENNAAADGWYDMQFKLYDDPNVLVGSPVGSSVVLEDIEVVDGYFIAELDFGSDPNVFSGNARWLLIAVRPGDEVGSYTPLSPLQEVTPTPYAMYASGSNWNNLANVPADFADGVDNEGITVETDPQVGSLSTNEVPRWDGSALASGIIKDTGSNAGIGYTHPDSMLYVFSDDDEWFGVLSVNQISTAEDRYAVYAVAPGNTTGNSYGVYGVSGSSTSSNYGIRGETYTDSTGNNIGVYGYATNGIGNAWAGYFSGDGYFSGSVGIGDTHSNSKLYVVSDDDEWFGVMSKNQISTTEDRYAFYGDATGNTTGNSYGVYGVSSSSDGPNYGIRGAANTDSTGNNFGVYGSAVNGGSGSAWAGYFSGDGYFSGSVGIGDTSPSGKLQIAGDEVRIGNAGTVNNATGDGDLYVEDTLEVDGTITTSYSSGTNNPAVPIAYAHISSSGSVSSGTPNVSSTWTGSRYEITIAGESYFYNDYITVVTPVGAGGIASTTSAGGKLVVYITNSGTNVQSNFQFITYKP